jgi:hypothetical protein
MGGVTGAGHCGDESQKKNAYLYTPKKNAYLLVHKKNAYLCSQKRMLFI